jgi:acetyl esterase/lipase
MTLPHDVDPEMAPGIEAFPVPDFTEDLLATVRGLGLPGTPPSDAARRTERIVPGEPPVPVRMYEPVTREERRPAVLAIHGGGFILGDRTMFDELFDRWCPELGLVGISVEYRLAPETAYPGALEDCYAALLWTVEHADELGVDAGRLGICGLSAGGGLAAGLALLVRDRGEVALAFQLLEYPMLDDRQITPSSRLDGLPVWSSRSNAFGWRSYLGPRYGADDVPPYAAPARATDLAGLPPAFVSVGSVDGFRDEDIDYALRLNQAGVPTELHVYPGAPHGFQLAGDTAISRQASHNADEWMRRQLRARAG